MKYLFFCIYFLVLATNISFAQENYYFPPLSSDLWESTTPSELNWNTSYIDSLNSFLEAENTKACIILYKGKIVYEKYFGSFKQDSLWYWASAGKTITSFLIGKAQELEYLKISDTSSNYLGKGWTSCPVEIEEKITIRHQLTMTSGFETLGVDWNCTDPECLLYKKDAGERWFYHNAPYTLLKDVLETSTGLTANQLTNQWLKNEIGMGGFWIQSGWNNLYISTARDMARFGSLIINNGDWNGKSVMSDKQYFYDMIHKSQDLNPAYGYLFWLNGTDKFIQPGLALEFPGSIIPDAPDDLFAAMGKNDQKLYIVPSKEFIVVRMGNAARESLLAVSGFDNDFWKLIDAFTSSPSHISNSLDSQLKAYPNPVSDVLSINSGMPIESIAIFNLLGYKLKETLNTSEINLVDLNSGVYLAKIEYKSDSKVIKIIKK